MRHSMVTARTHQCQMLCRDGDLSCFEEREMTEAEKKWKSERAGGNYGAGTKEIQARNYVAMKEMERKRKEMFEDALTDFRDGNIDKALVQFEEVKGLEPEKYIGDSFERVSRIYIVTLYNIACCYSAIKAVDAGLEALDECMRCGFDEFGKVWGPVHMNFGNLRLYASSVSVLSWRRSVGEAV